MLSTNDQDTKMLDILEFGDLLSIITIAFDKTGVKLHSKVLRKLKNYIKSSKRQQSEKLLLQQLSKSYK